MKIALVVVGLVAAASGLVFLGYMLISFARAKKLFQSRRKKMEARFTEQRALSDEIGRLHLLFLAQHFDTPQEISDELWKPVSDEIVKAVSALVGKEGDGEDEVAHLNRALKLAQPLFKTPTPEVAP